MNPTHDPRKDDAIPSDATDARLVQAIDAAWRPAPLTSGERAALRRAVEARVEAGRGRRWAWPALTAGAAAAFAAVMALGSPKPLTPPVGDVLAMAEVPTFDAALDPAWEEVLLLSTDLDESELVWDEAFLPDEYVALADAFLDF